MEWVEKVERCSIELLYAAADCGDEGPVEMLKQIAAILDLIVREAKRQ